MQNTAEGKAEREATLLLWKEFLKSSEKKKKKKPNPTELSRDT